MSLRNTIRLFQNQSGRKTKTFISKFSSNSKLWFKSSGGGGENGFCGSGWNAGGHAIAWKEFLSNRHPPHLEKFKAFKFNKGHVRGLRTSKEHSPLFSNPPKTSRYFLLTALEDPVRMSGIKDLFIKPVIFTALVAGGSFVGSTIWQYENHRERIRQNGIFSFMGDRNNPETNKAFDIRNSINLWWKKASVADKIFWPICALNILVFTAWHIPGLTSRMVTYFTATPASRAICWPMLLSTFSHYSVFHLGANMFVLHSFLPAATSLMGPEQFVGTYLAGGVISSLGSHVHKLLLGSNVPSLGASGSIMAILAYVCLKMPDIELGIIFIPGISFTADTAIKCILAVDTVGLLAGWRIMDHAAHLSGAIYGLGLCYFETSVIAARDKIMHFWHKIRNSST